MQTNAVKFFDDDLPEFVTRRDLKLQNKRKKSQLRKTQKAEGTPATLNIRPIVPLTENQRLTFEAFRDGQNLLLHGVAGTGKTFIALYLSLQSVIQGKAPKPIIILRSVVPSRDMGFLPGRLEEKIAVYEEPYRSLSTELTGHATSYDYMKSHGFVQFSTTSYLRGLTFHNNTIIVDECQNMCFAELDTIMTRVGEGCRVIFCGDFRQTDLIRDEERKGLHKFMGVVKVMPSFESIEFTEKDIVRSGLVKEYILAKLGQNIV